MYSTNFRNLLEFLNWLK